MDENLKITIFGLLTLIVGTILASIVASFGVTSMAPELLSFVIAAPVVFFGVNEANKYISKHNLRF